MVGYSVRASRSPKARGGLGAANRRAPPLPCKSAMRNQVLLARREVRRRCEFFPAANAPDRGRLRGVTDVTREQRIGVRNGSAAGLFQAADCVQSSTISPGTRAKSRTFAV